MKSSRQTLARMFGFVVGLYVTWRVANWLAWRQEGLDRDSVVGSADCDDCELTVLLDQIGVVLACFAAYLLLVWAASLVWRRRQSTHQ